MKRWQRNNYLFEYKPCKTIIPLWVVPLIPVMICLILVWGQP